MTIKKPNYANLPVTPYNFDSCTRKKEIINEPEQISFTDRVYLFFFQQLFLREKAMEARYNEDSRLNSTRLHVSPKEFREKKRKKKKRTFRPSSTREKFNIDIRIHRWRVVRNRFNRFLTIWCRRASLKTTFLRFESLERRVRASRASLCDPQRGRTSIIAKKRVQVSRHAQPSKRPAGYAHAVSSAPNFVRCQATIPSTSRRSATNQVTFIEVLAHFATSKFLEAIASVVQKSLLKVNRRE